MANSDKNIRITANRDTTALPKIIFTGQSNNPIALNVLDDNTISFEGSAGQLFSINNNLSSGYIFSINDISGIPSFRVNADGTVGIAEFLGNVGIGLTNPAYKLQISGSAGISGTANISGVLTLSSTTGSGSTSTGALVVSGGVGIGGSIFSSSAYASSLSGVVFNNGAITNTGTITSTGVMSISNSSTTAFQVRDGSNNPAFVIDTIGDIISLPVAIASTTTGTGSLVVAGGVGIGGSVNVGGRVGIGTNLLTGQINIRTSTASTPGIIVQGAASQTEDYLRIVSSTGTTSLTIDSSYKIAWPNTGTNPAKIYGTTYSTQGRVVVEGNLYVSTGPFIVNTGGGEASMTSTSISFGGVGWGSYGSPARVNTDNAVRIQPTSTSVVPLVVQLQNASWTSGNAFEIQNNSVLKFNVDYAGNTSILSTAGSASTTTGALVITGGVGIGQTLFTSPSYASSVSGVILNNGTITGSLSGTATTANNVRIESAGNTNSSHLITFTPNSSSSGSAISSDSTFSFNPSTEILSVSGIAITSTTASTSTTTGSLIVSGGVGIGNTLYVAGRVDASNYKAWVENRTLSSVDNCVGIGTFSINNGAHNILISLNVSDGGYSVAKNYTLTSNWNIGGWSIVAPLSSTGAYGNNSAINFQLEAYQGFGSLTLRARSLGTGGSLKIYVQNVGQNTATFTAYNTATSETAISTYHQYAFTSQENNIFKINSSLGSTSTSTGALIVTGGVGIGQSLFTSSSYASSISGVTFNNGAITNTGTITSTGVMSISNSSTTAFAVRDGSNSSKFNVDTVSGIVSVLSSTASTSTSSGALVVSGGVGIGGTLNVNNISGNLIYTPPAGNIGGTSWTYLTVPTVAGTSLNNVKYLNNRFVGFASTYIYYSNDAVTWTYSNPSGIAAGKYITDIGYGEGRYVYTINNGNFVGHGTNLTNWSTASVQNQDWAYVVYGNNRFVAINYGSTGVASTDGISWTQYSLNLGFTNGLNFLNGFFYAYSDSAMYRSADGIIWNQLTSPAYPRRLTYGNGLYVGAVYNSSTHVFSYDGVNFSTYTGTARIHSGAYYFNGIYYLTTNEAVLRYSTDGFNWSEVFTSVNGFLSYAQGRLWGGSGTSIWYSNPTSNIAFINPTTSSNLDNIEIGRYTPNSANFIDVSVNNSLNVSSAYNSTASSNGALVVRGGVGIGGSLYVASATAISGVTINAGVITGSLTGTATTSTYSHQSGYAITSGSSATANTATYSHQSGYATTSGLATTATYSHQSGYATTSGTASTATYAFQSGYGITAGLATTATYAHQSGYAITSGSSGSATTANNINVANALTNSAHTLLFSPTATGSGVAVSSNTTLSYNPSSFVLSTSGLAITATTASSSTSNGALQVAGGVGISGRLSFNQAAFGTTGIATNPTMAMIGNTGDPIFLSILEDNTISFEGSQGQLFSITPNLSTGYIYSVNDITGIPLLRANANANVTANEYAGNFGIGLSNPGYKLHVVGSVGFTSTTASTSTTTGTLVVSGGVGIGGSLYVNSPSNISNVIINNGVITGNLTGTATTSGFATTASYSNQAGYAITAGSATTATYSHQAGYAITAGSATTAFTAVSTTSVSVASAGNSNLAHPILITNNPSSGSAVSSDSTFTFNPSTEILNVSGISITSSTGSSNTTTGALIVTGGVGIGGSFNVGNKSRFNDDVYISSNSSNSLYSAGHGGLAGNWTVGGTLQSGKHLLGSDLGLYPVGGNQSVIQAVWGLQLIGNSGVLPANFTPTSYGSAGAISVLVPNQQANRVAFGIIANASQTADLQIWTSSTASTSSPYLAVKADGQIYSYVTTPATSYNTGALVVSGGVGIGGSLFVNGDLTINGTTTTINSVTLSVDDKNIELGSVGSPSDVTAEGGGITLKGATDKFINWYSGVGWSSSESWNLVSGSTFKINNTNVLSSTTLGTGVTNSSLTSVGTITSGTWAGTTITAHYGGTGLTTPFTVGDLLYANSSTTWARLPANSNSGYVLTSAGSGSTPVYASASSITTGSATTAFNLNVVLARSNANHSLLFSPSLGTASGAAVSNDGTLVFNPSTEILTVSGLAVTSSAATTSPSSGALTVSGGVGIGGTVNIQGDETVFGRLNYTQSTVGIAGTTVIPSISFIGQNNNPISLSVLADNTLSFEGSSGQLFSINNNLSSGTIFSVNDISGIPILRANANGTLSLGEFSGSVGVGLSLPSYKFHVNGSSGFGGTVFISGNTFIASSTTSTSTSTGALVVSGGVGIGGSLYVASPSNISNVSLNNGVITGNLTGTATTATYSIQSGYAITAGSSNTSGYATTSGLATTASNINVNAASSNANHYLIFSPNATGAGVALSSESTFIYNPSTDILSVSGLAVTSSLGSNSTTTGALVVTGGVGIGASVNIGRQLTVSGTTRINSSVFNNPPTSSIGASLVQSGYIFGSYWTGFQIENVYLIYGRQVPGGSIIIEEPLTGAQVGGTGNVFAEALQHFKWGNDKYVVLASTGNSVLYSTSPVGAGSSWFYATLPTSASWQKLEYGNNRFIAIATGSTSAYSLDGINWILSTLPGNYTWSDIKHGNGVFVAGTGSTVAYTYDGIEWTIASNNVASTFITFGNGLFFANSTSNTASYSRDGISWTNTTLPSDTHRASAYGNGVFVNVGNSTTSYFSTDLINWISGPGGSEGTTPALLYFNNLFYFKDNGAGYGKVVTGPTGTLDFSPRYTGEINNVRIGAITPGAAEFTALAAVGPVRFVSGVASTNYKSGSVVISGGVGIGGSLNTSTSFTSSISGLNILNGSLSSATSTIAATNKFQISVSDTAAFTVKNGGGTSVFNIDTTNSVTSVLSSTASTNTSTGALIVTGSVGVGGTVNANSVVTYNKLQNQSFSGSAVGATDGRSANTGALIGHDKISYGNGLFVTNSSWGAYNAAYSTDGTSWTASSLPVNQGYPVNFYGNGYFVLAASGATNVLYSANGTSWSQVSIGNTFNRTDGAYGNGKYVIVGTGQTYNYSSNLTTWTSGTLPLTGDWRIAYGNGTFVALGYGTRQIIYSYDGIYWNLANTKVDYALNWTGLKYANGRFIASSYSGTGSAYSLDGINWYSAVGTGGENLNQISYGNGVYFVNSYGSYYTSGDGTTYNNATSWSVAYEAGNTAYGLGKFQALGRFIDGPTNTVTIEPKFTGEINNVRIGAITPASGDFTNLSSTGSANLVGTVNAYDLNICLLYTSDAADE